MVENHIDKNELISFAEEKDPSAAGVVPSWKVLIVDDEADVHKVTRLVLAGFQFLGKSIEFLSSYSSAEAKESLRVNPDTAIVLLDVVMEEMDSGLKLVEYIRKELNNKYIRIILRTGQPGQAPERQVILQYDINDYKSKIELTSEKLLTSVISCLRSYVDMVTIERNRRGLEKIVVASDDIFRMQSLADFFHDIVFQMAEILRHESISDVIKIRGICATKLDGGFRINAVTGDFPAGSESKTVSELLSPAAYECFSLAAREKITVYERGFYAAVFRPSNGTEHIVFIEKDPYFDEWEKDLLEIFNANIVTAFENIFLNLELEQKVEIRTAELRGMKDDIEEALHELEIVNERLTLTNRQLEEAKTVADQDMRMAINVQENLLPHQPPVSASWQAGYCFKPMAGISGDFYDFFPGEDGGLGGMALFDVSGHGIASGLITMLAKSITFRRFRGMTDRPLSEVIDAINDDLIAELDNVPNFLSGVMLRFGADSAEYVNAGHPDLVVLKKDGSVYSLADLADNPKGFYLGIRSMRIPHGVCTIRVEKGEFLVAFSDCMVEAGDSLSAPYGLAGLQRSMKKIKPEMSAQEAADFLLGDFLSQVVSDPLPDDLTLVVIKHQ